MFVITSRFHTNAGGTLKLLPRTVPIFGAFAIHYPSTYNGTSTSVVHIDISPLLQAVFVVGRDGAIEIRSGEDDPYPFPRLNKCKRVLNTICDHHPV
eukprot:2241257-Pyramimonas_sp.AAC.1